MFFLDKVNGPEVKSSAELSKIACADLELQPQTGVDVVVNPLLKCSPQYWQIAHPGEGSMFSEYRFVGGGLLSEGDPRQLAIDTRMSPFSVSIGTRAVGSICHGMETFRCINDKHGHPESSPLRLKRADALFLGRACALATYEDIMNVTADLVSDLLSEIRSILKSSMRSLIEFVGEVAKFVHKQALYIEPMLIEASAAALLGQAKNIRQVDTDNESFPFKTNESCVWRDSHNTNPIWQGDTSAPAPCSQRQAQPATEAAAQMEDVLANEADRPLTSGELPASEDSQQVETQDKVTNCEKFSSRLALLLNGTDIDFSKSPDSTDADATLVDLTTVAIEALLRALLFLKSAIEMPGNETPGDVIADMTKQVI